MKEAERKKLLDIIKDWLKDVKIKKEDDWGQKPLAYAIKHEESGHYYMLAIESNPEDGKAIVPKDFEQRILRQEDVIRHLLLRTK